MNELDGVLVDFGLMDHLVDVLGPKAIGETGDIFKADFFFNLFLEDEILIFK